MPERRPSTKRPGITATGRQWQVIEALTEDGWLVLTKPEAQELGDVLRNAAFALERVQAALVAFVPAEHGKAVSRDFDRCGEARQAIKTALERLPDAVPLTPEEEATVIEEIGRALRTFDA